MSGFKIKACMIDISRFRVPTKERLIKILKNISHTGYDTVFFNIEHVFKITDHPMIGAEADGFKDEEFVEISKQAGIFGLQLIPLIQSFGHMFHILKWDEYQHLSETDKKWSVSVSDQTYKLIDDIYKKAASSFSSDYIHIGGDEVYDMAEGKSKHLLEKISKGELFLNHILRLQEIAAKYGKKIVIWGDMIDRDPEVMDKLGNDLIICYWNYGFSDMPDTYKNIDAKILVCPGTNTWKSFFPRYEFAVKNYQLMKERADELDAFGFMITDWGDAGHIHTVSFTENLFNIAFSIFDLKKVEKYCANDEIDRIIKLLDKVHYSDYLNSEPVIDHCEYVTKLMFHDDPFSGTGYSFQNDDQLEELINRIDEIEKISENAKFDSEFEKDIKLFIDQTLVLRSKVRLHMLIRHGAEKALIKKSVQIFVIQLRRWFSEFMRRWLETSQPMGLYFHIHFMKKIEKDLIDSLKTNIDTEYSKIQKRRLYDDPEYLNLFSVGSSDALIKLWDEFLL